MERTVFIYILIDPIDNNVKYIGQTFRIERRLSEHLRPTTNSKKDRWIKSLINKDLQPTLVVIDECIIEDWVWLERYWVSQFKTWGFELKNGTEGGDGSYGVIPWNKGLKGAFKHSDESKEKMSKSRKGKPKNYVIRWSDERKMKFSATMTGRKLNMKVDKNGANNSNSKIVYCYDLGYNLVKIYDYGRQSKEDGFNPSLVSEVCRGAKLTHRGHIFSFTPIIKN